MLTRKQLIEAIVEARGPDGSKQRTWREVAALLYPRRDPNATAALLNKMYHHPEYDPGPRIRKCLGLSPLVPAPACPICGAAHTIDGVCTAGKAVTVTVRDGAPGVIVRHVSRMGKPRPRASVNTENPDSAFTTLREKTSPEFRRRLLELLQAEGD